MTRPVIHPPDVTPQGFTYHYTWHAHRDECKWSDVNWIIWRYRIGELEVRCWDGTTIAWVENGGAALQKFTPFLDGLLTPDLIDKEIEAQAGDHYGDPRDATVVVFEDPFENRSDEMDRARTIDNRKDFRAYEKTIAEKVRSVRGRLVRRSVAVESDSGGNEIVTIERELNYLIRTKLSLARWRELYDERGWPKHRLSTVEK